MRNYEAALAKRAALDQDLVVNPGHLANWRAKLAHMDNGENVVAKVGVWGCSIAEGYYVEASPMTIATVQAKSYIGLLNEYYKAKYTDVGWGWKPTNGIGGSTSAHEHYWTKDVGSWGEDTSLINGGQGLRFYHASLDHAQISSSFNGTGVDVVFEKCLNGSNDVEILIDSASNQHVNLYLAADPNQTYVVSITGLTDTDHTISIINHQIGKVVLVDGIRTIKGVKGVQFLNYSHSGKDTNALQAVATTAPDMLNKSLTLFSHDLAIFTYLINDHGNNIGVSAYKSRLEAYIDAAIAASMEVMLLPYIPAYTTKNTLGETRNQYYEAMRQVAYDKGVCMVDLWARWNAQRAKMSTLFLEDGTHPKAIGHRDLYKAILAVLES